MGEPDSTAHRLHAEVRRVPAPAQAARDAAQGPNPEELAEVDQCLCIAPTAPSIACMSTQYRDARIAKWREGARQIYR
jgi:hypothetical protein